MTCILSRRRVTYAYSYMLHFKCMHMLPYRACMGAFQHLWAQSEAHWTPDYTGKLATSATAGQEKFSNASIISLERIFINVNSINNVHFHITLKLPVVRSGFAVEVASVQNAEFVVSSNQKRKNVERTSYELSNVDGKFTHTRSPGDTDKGMSADLQGRGLGPTTVSNKNPAPWTAWEVGICLHWLMPCMTRPVTLVLKHTVYVFKLISGCGGRS